MTIPPKIIAGNPSAKIFKEGAERVMTPRPRFINNKEAKTGSAIINAPTNMLPDQTSNPSTIEAIDKGTPTGSTLKLSAII